MLVALRHAGIDVDAVRPIDHLKDVAPRPLLFITGTAETTLGPHYYLQGNFTTNRGDMSYDQFMFSLGYRFDSKRKGE